MVTDIVWVERMVEARLPTAYGVFRAVGYHSLTDQLEHLALVMGEIDAGKPLLVRLHSECLTGDVFDSRRCDCGHQLSAAMSMIAAEGAGVIVYIRGHEGRGIGLLDKLAAYNLQDAGRDTAQANEDLGLPVDARDYKVGAEILRELGVRKIRLLSNNPIKRAAIEKHGLSIVERLPLIVTPNDDNRDYLRAKRDKLGHLLPADDGPN